MPTCQAPTVLSYLSSFQSFLLSNFPSSFMQFREALCRALAQHAGVLFPIPSTVGMGEATRLTCNLVIVLFSLRQGRALGSKLGEEGLHENTARTVGPHGFLSFSISPKGCVRWPGFSF